MVLCGVLEKIAYRITGLYHPFDPLVGAVQLKVFHEPYFGFGIFAIFHEYFGKLQFMVDMYFGRFYKSFVPDFGLQRISGFGIGIGKPGRGHGDEVLPERFFVLGNGFGISVLIIIIIGHAVVVGYATAQ
jgi:hypothetical protein